MPVQPTSRGRFRGILVVVACALISGAVGAQDLEVSLSPFSPGAEHHKPKAGLLTIPLGAFRFTALAAPVQVEGVILTGGGTANFATDLATTPPWPVAGLEAWQDNGDGVFRPIIDALLAETSGDSPTTTVMFTNPITVGAGMSIDVWIVVSPTNTRTYSASIASAGDVIAPGAVVTLAQPSPTTALMTVTYKGGAEGGSDVGPHCTATPQASNACWSLCLLASAAMVVRIRRRA